MNRASSRLPGPAGLRIAGLLAILALLAGCRGCDPHAQVERDRKRFPSLSQSRPPGSPCRQGDSASVKRAAAHPLGPTGVWSSVAEFDLRRTIERESNVLAANGGVISGYVQFDEEGELRVRIYDDVYGEVYGGWSPAGLLLPRTVRRIFVALGTGSFGDGGLSQVTEVCWTPRGGGEGRIVFSSAHPQPGPPLRARELFRPGDLEIGDRLNGPLAVRMLSEIIQERDERAARDLLEEAAGILSASPGAVDGSTGKPIPAREFYADDWANLLAFQLGLAIGGPEFAFAARSLEETVRAPSAARFCRGCDRYRRMLPLYRWVDARARGERREPPAPEKLESGVPGHDPVAIARLLRGEAQGKQDEAELRFWSGVSHFAAGDLAAADKELSAWLDSPPTGLPSGFERGAALVLTRLAR